MNHICLNGNLLPENEPALLVSNRGYRYGDGLFETIKIMNGEILLADYHFERLFSGLSLLQFDIPVLFTPQKISTEIVQLCKKNDCLKLARARLSVFRGNGGLYDPEKGLQYVIECWSLNESVNSINENGYVIDVFPTAQKSTDAFSNLKSANFLPYSQAALYASNNKLNDCLVLNNKGNIADSTVANIFIVKGDMIYTPALTEGCVNGVMRRYVIEKMRDAGYRMEETSLSIADIENAGEIFLTNAINGIRWVRQFRDKLYSNQKTTEFYNQFSAIFSL